MRKLIALLASALLLFCSAPTAFAASEERIDLGDGFYMVIHSEPENVPFASTGRYKTADVYKESIRIGTMTVYARFEYTGSSVSVTEKDCTASGANGWTVKDKWASGVTNQVTGYAIFTSGSQSKTASLTITCDKNGNIS